MYDGKKVLGAQAYDITGVKLPKLHELTWATDLLDVMCCSKKEAAVVICGMWSLWMMRNDRWHNKDPIPFKQTLEWVRDTAYDLWHIIHKKKDPGKNMELHWHRPLDQWHKCHTDGAFSATTKCGATAAVIRDHDGKFVAAEATWHEKGSDPLLMEAIACRDGIWLAQRVHSWKICLETDCQELSNLWATIDVQRSAVNLILRDIKDLSRSFDEFKFVFAPRSCNKVAHQCARQVSKNTTPDGVA